MSGVKTWMPLYVGDYLKDTMHLELHEHGAYLLLLMQHWNLGSLPDDDKQLAKILRLRPAQFARMSGTLRQFFYSSGGRLYQKRTLRELEAANSRRVAAQESATKRWNGKGPKRSAKAYAKRMRKER